MKRLSTLIIALMAVTAVMAQGWPQQYGGVMLQAFYWDSYDDTQWSLLEQQADDLSQTFDLVWIPQSGNCGGTSMGYDDLYWFSNYNSSFGNEQQLRSMIQTFKQKGIGTIADVVINHRKTLSSWTDFPAETYKGVNYQLTANDICSDDEAGKNGYAVGPNKDTGEGWDGMRDLDHKSSNVQNNVKAYLDFLLNDLGYTGFRYDMVKGYDGAFTKIYNESAKPQFSVGECWDATSVIRKWIDAAEKSSAAFDFQFRYVVRNAANKGNWLALDQQNDGNWPLVSSRYENGAYRQYAVTFVENHDTERRSNAAQDPLLKDTLAANAHMMAMPGTPCVFMTHWKAYAKELRAMIAARKLAGLHNTSSTTKLAGNMNFYATVTDGTRTQLLCVVGPLAQEYVPDANWVRILSGYHYVYCMPKSANTAWVDLASGTYEGKQTAVLTAVSTDDTAQLVYTTDGTDPTPQSKRVASGTSIDIDVTEVPLTMKVGLLSGGTVSGIITRTYSFKQKEPEKPFEIPSFCVVNAGETCAFFEAPATWTGTICCWAWTNSPSDNFTYANKNWPGVACTLLGTAANGNKVWKWTWDGTKQNNSSAKQPQMIIFSNNGAPQTADMVFENGGYYNKDGLKGNVAAGIGGATAPEVGSATVYTLHGVRLTGQPRPGIYVKGNKKVVIR